MNHPAPFRHTRERYLTKPWTLIGAGGSTRSSPTSIVETPRGGAPDVGAYQR
jgi:hypothetical protein